MTTRFSLIFYLVFLGQILLISHYIPRKFLERARYVLAHYPPSSYPKLYPRSADLVQFGHRVFELSNRVILVLGFLLLYALTQMDHSEFADDGFISEMWPTAYGLLQFIPLMAFELSEYSQFKRMRQVSSTSMRKAVLRPRRLVDFVSPSLFVVAVSLLLTAVLADLWRGGFEWQVGALGNSLVLVASHICLAIVGAWTLRGPKLNPHQATADRTRQIGLHLRSLFYLSIAMSVYFLTVTANHVVDLEAFNAALISLYFQVIVLASAGFLIRNLEIEDMDFDVYKSESALG